MKVLINAVSAKLGGAATYVNNLASALPCAANSGDEFVFVLPGPRQFASTTSQIRVISSDAATGSYARRWWWDQVELRRIVADEKPDVLFSSANFAMLRCPCPQVLLVRNPIYFSQHYLDHVLPQRGLALRAETIARRWLVAQSVAAADCLMLPSRAMLDDLARHVRLTRQVLSVNPYGVPTSHVLKNERLPRAHGPLRILWVSHYADHKNLGTLLRAATILRNQGNTPFTLALTLDPAGGGQHTAMPAADSALLHSLGDSVQLVGVASYERVWQLYAEADVFVFPSLTESFGHPLVEAMASQLPILASDIPIHREICADAALYFEPFDAPRLAVQLQHFAASAAQRAHMARLGRARVQSFLWEDHVKRLLATLRDTAQRRQSNAIAA